MLHTRAHTIPTKSCGDTYLRGRYKVCKFFVTIILVEDALVARKQQKEYCRVDFTSLVLLKALLIFF